MWAEFAKDRVITYPVGLLVVSICKYLKRVLPNSEETGLGEATTKSAKENVRQVKEYYKINYTMINSW